MTNVLFVYVRKMATTEGMHEIFCSDDAKKYGINSMFVNTWKIKGCLLAWADVIVFVRNLDLLSQWILVKAKKAGICIIQFFDDDVLNLPKEAVNRVQYLPWRKKAIKKGFDNTDIILSSNRLLAEKYARMTKSHRFVNLDTIVDPASLVPMGKREKEYDDNKVKIVFAAGANHEDTFDKYIRPKIGDLIQRFGNRISLSFFGVHPDLSQYEDKIEVNYIGAMSLGQYRKTIQNGYYDIGLAPLESNDFTKYKYFNKFIEYTIAGVTGVYSNVLPYTLIVKNRENGFLAKNTPEGWFEVLCEAIENNALRRSCYRHAYEQIILEMRADGIFGKMLRDIPELKSDHVNKKGIGILGTKVIFLLFRFVEVIYLVIEYIRLTGINGAIKKIKSYIDDRKATMTEKLGE